MYSLSIRIGEFGEQNWRKINNIKYSTILIHYIFITFDWLDLFSNLKVRKALKQGIQFSVKRCINYVQDTPKMLIVNAITLPSDAQMVKIF